MKQFKINDIVYIELLKIGKVKLLSNGRKNKFTEENEFIYKVQSLKTNEIIQINSYYFKKLNNETT